LFAAQQHRAQPLEVVQKKATVGVLGAADKIIGHCHERGALPL